MGDHNPPEAQKFTNNLNIFICQYCGKECKSTLSKSCHERLCKLNPNKVDTTYLSQNAVNTNKKLSNKYKEYKLSLKKIIFECVCENCGKKFYIKDYENRKDFPKCCSSFCRHSLSGKTNSQGTKQIKCKQCGNLFEVNKHYSGNCICDKCKNENLELKRKQKEEKIKKQKESLKIKVKKKKSQKKTIKYISEEIRQKFREAGKKSARKQAEIRRSKNEIEFCELCKNYFDNVEHNKPMFNGWDADVILPDIKFAILWNGKVHYEPIFGQANFNRVINRDKIKLKDIQNAGYIPYIIKDVGKYNDNFVQEKFDEFIEVLKENNHIII